MSDETTITKEAMARQKSRTRSPAYPTFGLEEAIRKSKALYDQEDHHLVPIDVAAIHWDFAPTSSAGLQAVSALKQFGLLVDEGTGKKRRVKLSDLAMNILLREENSSERDEAIRAAALNPKIHRELWDKYDGKPPPSDASIRLYLLRERPDSVFNKDAVDGFISQFRTTLTFAKLDKPDTRHLVSYDKNTSGPADMSTSRTTNTVSTVSPEQPAQAGSVPASPQTYVGARKPVPVGLKEDVFTLDEGQVVITWPEKMSADSFEDFQSWLQLVIRKAKRSIQNDQFRSNE